MNGVTKIDAVAEAQAERLRQKAERQERERQEAEARGEQAAPANDAGAPSVEKTISAEPQKLGELHMEIFADGKFDITAPFHDPTFIMNCISMLMQTLINSQVQAKLQAAIAAAEAQVPPGSLPVWQRVRGAMKAAAKKVLG